MIATNNLRPILFVHYGDDWIRGSERCLLDLLSHLNRQKFIPIVWCNSTVMAEAVNKLKIEVICQPFPLLFGWHAPIFDFISFFKLVKHGIKLVERYNIKLIHSNSGAPCQWLNIVARHTKLPLVAHLHCRYPLRDRITFGLHHVSQLFTVSNCVAQQFINDCSDRQKISVVLNGIDKARFSQDKTLYLRQQLGLASTDYLLFSAGSLIHRKGMDLLISAVEIARKNGIPAKLVIAGDGPCKAQLIEQINQAGLCHQVFLLGERNDIAQLLQGGIDVFLSGAREEVFGLVLAEAGLNKLPVIAPAVGGIPEVIQDKRTGLLVPPQDPLQIAQAIEWLYRDPEFSHQLGIAAKKRVEQRFLIEQNVAVIEQHYLSLLQDQHNALTWSSHWDPKALIKSCGVFLFNIIIGQRG